MYDFALVSKQQLEDVGFNIDLQVVDWATLVKRRNNPKEYDAFTTGMGNFYDPTNTSYLTPSWPGWTCDEQIQSIKTAMIRETDYKKRFALWEQMHKVFYEKVPSSATATSSAPGGLEEAQGLQREDRADADLQRVARQVAQDPLSGGGRRGRRSSPSSP